LSVASDTLFTPREGGFVASAHARGPWDERALHGGAAAALITHAFEHHPAAAGMRIARLQFELLRPVPFGPLALDVDVQRDGRRVQELAAAVRAEGELICRASALRVQEVPAGLPLADVMREAVPGPEQGHEIRFTLDHADGQGFGATGMEMRWLDDPRALGPSRVWMRPRLPLLPGANGSAPQGASPLATLAATADFGNGVSAVLPFGEYVFINADLAIHLHRQPRGEWIGLDARTVLEPGGTGLAECVLHDVHGPVGRSFQTLVVGRR
jgi:hypothetical protein